MADDTKFRDYRGTEGQVQDATAPPAVRRDPAPRAPVQGGITLEQAKETERKPKADEGSKAYGAPMQGSAFDRQNTDSNN